MAAVAWNCCWTISRQKSSPSVRQILDGLNYNSTFPLRHLFWSSTVQTNWLHHRLCTDTSLDSERYLHLKSTSDHNSPIEKQCLSLRGASINRIKTSECSESDNSRNLVLLLRQWRGLRLYWACFSWGLSVEHVHSHRSAKSSPQMIGLAFTTDWAFFRDKQLPHI